MGVVQRLRDARQRREDDRMVVVSALLSWLGPSTATELRRYTGGRYTALASTLNRLTGCGAVEAEWIDGPYPRQRAYRLVRPIPSRRRNGLR